jgi:hypothetical protein
MYFYKNIRFWFLALIPVVSIFLYYKSKKITGYIYLLCAEIDEHICSYTIKVCKNPGEIISKIDNYNLMSAFEIIGENDIYKILKNTMEMMGSIKSHTCTCVSAEGIKSNFENSVKRLGINIKKYEI